MNATTITRYMILHLEAIDAMPLLIPPVCPSLDDDDVSATGISICFAKYVLSIEYPCLSILGQKLLRRI